MVGKLRQWGFGATVALAALPTWADEPARLGEPKPLNNAAVEPALVPSGEHEVVRERYPNRNIKVERHTAQDADGNFVNHGTWTMWDEQGRVMGSGEFNQGQRTGTWIRNYVAGECELVNGPLGKQFAAPFVSTAHFEQGEIEGAWTLVDSKGRNVFEWNFKQGKRHGQCVWYYPNGEVWREIEYVNGEPNGEFIEWTPDGQILAAEKYVNGHRELMQVEWHSPGVKKTEAQYLMARELTQVTIDWWNGIYRIKVTGREGQDQRHGPWTTWHKNGQIAGEGEYRFDQPEGKFTFWHENGQKSIEGQYIAGNQTGRWTWWHDNGQKSIAGEFENGEQIGAWNWWLADGKLTEAAVYSDPIVNSKNRVVPDKQITTRGEKQPISTEPTLAPLQATKPGSTRR